ncbi:MAG: M1 family metallopeptidase [Clostridia bacterium]|nr:M1 family metallopeptidase [Clostridia bacterium]
MKKIICIILCVLCLNVTVGCSNEESLVSEYNISVTLNSDMTASCNLTLNYVNETKEKIDFLEFMLYPNAFSKGSEIKPIYSEYVERAFENGVSYGGIEITSVKQDEKSARFEVIGGKKHFLKVELLEEVKSGKNTQISIDFLVTLPNVNHRFGYGKNTVNLTGFYPILCPLENGEYYESVYYPSGDPFYSDVANYKVNLTVPSAYVIASSMSPELVEIEGERTTYSYARNGVREVAFILSKNFNVIKKSAENAEVFYYYFNDENAENSLETAIKSLDYFSNKYVEYPYEEYVFCEADFIYGGMEYPCLTMIDKDLNGFERDYTIVHETAHQWWYGLVGVNQSENAFIDEGLTEYSTVMFFDNFSEYNKSKKQLFNAVYNAYFELRKSLLKEDDLTPKMNRNLGEFSSDLDYVSIAYYRAQLTFRDLCEFMGEKRFDKFLKNLCAKYAYKNLTLNNLLLTAEKYKKGAKNFLVSYIDGSVAVK